MFCQAFSWDFNINIFVLKLPLLLKLSGVPVLLHEQLYFLEKKVRFWNLFISLPWQLSPVWCIVFHISSHFKSAALETVTASASLLLTLGQVLFQVFYICCLVIPFKDPMRRMFPFSRWRIWSTSGTLSAHIHTGLPTTDFHQVGPQPPGPQRPLHSTPHRALSTRPLRVSAHAQRHAP